MALISTSKILVGFHGPAYGTPAASVAQRNEWSGVTDGGMVRCQLAAQDSGLVWVSWFSTSQNQHPTGCTDLGVVLKPVNQITQTTNSKSLVVRERTC